MHPHFCYKLDCRLVYVCVAILFIVLFWNICGHLKGHHFAYLRSKCVATKALQVGRLVTSKSPTIKASQTHVWNPATWSIIVWPFLATFPLFSRNWCLEISWCLIKCDPDYSYCQLRTSFSHFFSASRAADKVVRPSKVPPSIGPLCLRNPRCVVKRMWCGYKRS